MRNIGIIAKRRFAAADTFVLQEESIRIVVTKLKSEFRKDWKEHVSQ